MPLLVIVGVGCVWIGWGWEWVKAPVYRQPTTLIPMALLAECVLAILLLAWWIGTAKIYRAATHSTGLAQIGVAAGMLVGCILGIAASLWLLPSIVAFFRLLIASLR